MISNTSTRTSALLSVMMLVLYQISNVYSRNVQYAHVYPHKSDVKIVFLDRDATVTQPNINLEGSSLLDADDRASTLDTKMEVVSTMTSDKLDFREKNISSTLHQFQTMERSGSISEKHDGNALSHHKDDRKSFSHHKNEKKSLSHRDGNENVVTRHNEVNNYDNFMEKLQDGGESTTSHSFHRDVGKEIYVFQPFTTMNIPEFESNYQFDVAKDLNKQQHYDHGMDDIMDDSSDTFPIIFMNVAQKILRIMILVCAVGAIVTLCRKKGCCKKKKTDKHSETTQYDQQNDDQERLVNEV